MLIGQLSEQVQESWSKDVPNFRIVLHLEIMSQVFDNRFHDTLLYSSDLVLAQYSDEVLKGRELPTEARSLRGNEIHFVENDFVCHLSLIHI